MTLPDSPLITEIIRLAIEEDCAHADITANLTVPEAHQSTGEFIVKEDLIICGLPLLEKLYLVFGADIQLKLLSQDGDEIKTGSKVAEICGNTRDILATERIALNFLQHLSGISSLTRSTVLLAPQLKILDTRKTTPGLRCLQKYAVQIGGGTNHRQNLSDMILVKNNHIDANGGQIEEILAKILKEKPSQIPLEVEVRNNEELKRVLPFKPDFIMLDNMNDEQVKISSALIRADSPATQIEVSGGITAERLKTLAELGADCVSMGMLTNKAQSKDISLRVKSMS